MLKYFFYRYFILTIHVLMLKYLFYQGLIDSYRRRGHVTSIKPGKIQIKLKVVEILNMHSAVQTSAVTIISYYKPLSDVNFVRYTQYYGMQLHALFSFRVYKPLTL